MARLVTTLSVNLSLMQPMFDSMATLGEALATAQFDGEIELENAEGGLLFRSELIAALTVGKFRQGVAFMRATPTFRMPLFAAEVCRMVPGVKVAWQGGWPHFSTPDDDDSVDAEPDPVAPERVLA